MGELSTYRRLEEKEKNFSVQRIMFLEKRKLSNVKTEEHKQQKLAEHRQNFKCYKIHKGLKMHAMKKLKNQKTSIDKDFIYHDLHKLADHVKTTFLEK